MDQAFPFEQLERTPEMGLAGKTNLLRVHRIQAHDWTEEQAAAEVE